MARAGRAAVPDRAEPLRNAPRAPVGSRTCGTYGRRPAPSVKRGARARALAYALAFGLVTRTLDLSSTITRPAMTANSTSGIRT